jgi:hypothetical protein
MVCRFQPNRKKYNPTVTGKITIQILKANQTVSPQDLLLFIKLVTLLCQVKLHIIYI